MMSHTLVSGWVVHRWGNAVFMIKKRTLRKFKDVEHQTFYGERFCKRYYAEGMGVLGKISALLVHKGFIKSLQLFLMWPEFSFRHLKIAALTVDYVF